MAVEVDSRRGDPKKERVFNTPLRSHWRKCTRERQLSLRLIATEYALSVKEEVEKREFMKLAKVATEGE